MIISYAFGRGHLFDFGFVYRPHRGNIAAAAARPHKVPARGKRYRYGINVRIEQRNFARIVNGVLGSFDARTRARYRAREQALNIGNAAESALTRNERYPTVKIEHVAFGFIVRRTVAQSDVRDLGGFYRKPERRGSRERQARFLVCVAARIAGRINRVVRSFVPNVAVRGSARRIYYLRSIEIFFVCGGYSAYNAAQIYVAVIELGRTRNGILDLALFYGKRRVGLATSRKCFGILVRPPFFGQNVAFPIIIGIADHELYIVPFGFIVLCFRFQARNGNVVRGNARAQNVAVTVRLVSVVRGVFEYCRNFYFFGYDGNVDLVGQNGFVIQILFGDRYGFVSSRFSRRGQTAVVLIETVEPVVLHSIKIKLVVYRAVERFVQYELIGDHGVALRFLSRYRGLKRRRLSVRIFQIGYLARGDHYLALIDLRGICQNDVCIVSNTAAVRRAPNKVRRLRRIERCGDLIHARL